MECFFHGLFSSSIDVVFRVCDCHLHRRPSIKNPKFIKRKHTMKKEKKRKERERKGKFENENSKMKIEEDTSSFSLSTSLFEKRSKERLLDRFLPSKFQKKIFPDLAVSRPAAQLFFTVGRTQTKS